ncbi:SRPBCC family protein [Marinicella rhabdoformis]|uniref:SRPBCC family protein n=1 Tax=Marinicella rhabdoformis TaxID=2580566 RepID=UPI0015CFA3BB
MKYQNQITINAKRDTVIELLDNPENMKFWQRGLVSYELLGEEQIGVGAQMKLNYKMGKRDVEMLETIVTYDLPERFDAIYEAKGVWNLVENHFAEQNNGQTVWTADCEFKFSGFMRVMSWVMPKSMFQKQSCQYLEDFKKFVESQQGG